MVYCIVTSCQLLSCPLSCHGLLHCNVMIIVCQFSCHGSLHCYAVSCTLFSCIFPYLAMSCPFQFTIYNVSIFNDSLFTASLWQTHWFTVLIFSDWLIVLFIHCLKGTWTQFHMDWLYQWLTVSTVSDSLLTGPLSHRITSSLSIFQVLVKFYLILMFEPYF
jgi:hypothetical protein